MNFTRLTPAEYPRFKPYFAKQKYDLCAYSLASIIAWTSEGFFQPLGAEKDGMFVICAEYYKNPGQRHMILPVCLQDEPGPRDLAGLAREAGHDQYWFVPEDYIERSGRSLVETYFSITPQPELNDYVYRAGDLANLAGNAYSKKRNLVRQFERDHAGEGRVRLEPITPDVVPECCEFIDKWCKEHGCDYTVDDDLLCERRAAVNAMENLEILEARGICLRLDGQISAFGVASRVTDSMGALHFEKAFASIKGLYQYFDRECARRLFEGFSYINKESDMGVEGLAKAKDSYHPAKIIKSFKLTLL